MHSQYLFAKTHRSHSDDDGLVCAQRRLVDTRLGNRKASYVDKLFLVDWHVTINLPVPVSYYLRPSCRKGVGVE